MLCKSWRDRGQAHIVARHARNSLLYQSSKSSASSTRLRKETAVAEAARATFSAALDRIRTDVVRLLGTCQGALLAVQEAPTDPSSPRVVAAIATIINSLTRRVRERRAMVPEFSVDVPVSAYLNAELGFVALQPPCPCLLLMHSAPRNPNTFCTLGSVWDLDHALPTFTCKPCKASCD